MTTNDPWGPTGTPTSGAPGPGSGLPSYPQGEGPQGGGSQGVSSQGVSSQGFGSQGADFPAALPNRPNPSGQGWPAGPPNQPGQPYPPGQGSPDQWGQTTRRGAGMATTALVLGIVAIVLSITVVGGILFGLVAIILGIIAAGRAKRGEAPGRGRAVAGIITGAVGLALAVALVIVGVTFLNSSSVKNLESCLKSAGSNQAQVQACDNQFSNQLTK